MKNLDLFGSETQGLSPFVNAQQRLNCFFEVIPSGEKGVNIFIRPTPGYQLFTTLSSGPLQGWIVNLNTLYVMAGGIFYSVNAAGEPTIIGTTLPGNSTAPVSMSCNGRQVLVCTGSSGWIYTITKGTYGINQTSINAGSFYRISDANFNQNATSCCYLNTFFIIPGATNGEFQISNSFDGTVWPALQFATAQYASDQILRIAAWTGTLVLFCSTHIEFWQDTGDYPFPFRLLGGTSQDWGIAAPLSAAPFNNTYIFLATNAAGSVQIMLFNGYQPQRVSDHNIENIINTMEIIEDAIGFSYTLDGHIFYQLTFPNGGMSFLYDGITNMWSILQSGTESFTPHAARNGISFANNYYIYDSNTGNIYEFDDEFGTDNGSPIIRRIQSRHIQDKGNKFSLVELFLDVNLGSTLQQGPAGIYVPGSTPQISMQYSKDNANTWISERWTSIGLVGQYSGPRAIWRRCGQGIDYVFRFTFTDPIPLIIIKGTAKIIPSTEKDEYGK